MSNIDPHLDRIEKIADEMYRRLTLLQAQNAELYSIAADALRFMQDDEMICFPGGRELFDKLGAYFGVDAEEDGLRSELKRGGKNGK